MAQYLVTLKSSYLAYLFKNAMDKQKGKTPRLRALNYDADGFIESFDIFKTEIQINGHENEVEIVRFLPWIGYVIIDTKEEIMLNMITFGSVDNIELNYSLYAI